MGSKRVLMPEVLCNLVKSVMGITLDTKSTYFKEIIEFFLNYCIFINTPLYYKKSEGLSDSEAYYKAVLPLFRKTYKQFFPDSTAKLSKKELSDEKLREDFYYLLVNNNDNGDDKKPYIHINFPGCVLPSVISESYDGNLHIVNCDIAGALKRICLSDYRKTLIYIMLFYLAYHDNPPKDNLNYGMYCVHGNKRGKLQKAVDNALINGHTFSNVYDVCAGELGLSVLDFDIEENGRLYINDFDYEKFNFLKVVMEKPMDLINVCLSIDVEAGDKVFNNIKEYFNDKVSAETFSAVQRAAFFFYLNRYSCWHKEENFQNVKYAWYKAIFRIGAYSRYLHANNAKLSNKSCLEIISLRNSINSRGNLVLIDPPYYDTVGYNTRNESGESQRTDAPKKEDNVKDHQTDDTEAADNKGEEQHSAAFGKKQHMELAEKILKLKADFIYHCRTTSTREKDFDIDDVKKKDKELQAFLVEMFGGKKKRKLYYVIIPYHFSAKEANFERQALKIEYELVITSLKPEDSEFTNLNKQYSKKLKPYVKPLRWGEF